MNELALFAGAGGGLLASQLLGWKTICAVENDPFCIRRLMQRQNEGYLPSFPIWDDVHTFDGTIWEGIIDVVSGGFPCQPFSKASSGRIIAEDLWPEMLRIIKEVKPKYVFSENVTYDSINNAAECLRNLGADHIRERYWLRAYSNNEGKLYSKINAETSCLSCVCTSFWTSNPGESRISNGMAYRMDRLRATGNGQVPAVARYAWKMLEFMEKNKMKKCECDDKYLYYDSKLGIYRCRNCGWCS